MSCVASCEAGFILLCKATVAWPVFIILAATNLFPSDRLEKKFLHRPNGRYIVRVMKAKILFLLFLSYFPQVFGSVQEKLFLQNQVYVSTLNYYLARKGFFAEINCLLNTIVFCLQNKVKLNLNSDFFLYRENCGWEDYFKPFTKTQKPAKDLRHFVCEGLDKVFNIIYNYNFNKVNIPRLDLSPDNIFENKRKVARLVYRYNSKTKKLIKSKINELNLPDDYIAFHIRRGDKIGERPLQDGASIEAEKHSSKDYLEKLLELKDLKIESIKNIFISTDSYISVKELEEFIEQENLDIKIYTTCNKNHIGWSTKESKVKFENKFDETMRLLTDAEICFHSKYFVGTYSSNMSRFITLMHDNPKNCLSLDKFIDPFPTRLHEKFNYENGWCHA